MPQTERALVRSPVRKVAAEGSGKAAQSSGKLADQNALTRAAIAKAKESKAKLESKVGGQEGGFQQVGVQVGGRGVQEAVKLEETALPNHTRDSAVTAKELDAVLSYFEQYESTHEFKPQHRRYIPYGWGAG